jgi:hypothetical protein
MVCGACLAAVVAVVVSVAMAVGIEAWQEIKRREWREWPC